VVLGLGCPASMCEQIGVAVGRRDIEVACDDFASDHRPVHLRHAQALVKEENGAIVELDVRTGRPEQVSMKPPPSSMLEVSGPLPASCSAARFEGLIAVISDSSSLRSFTADNR